MSKAPKKISTLLRDAAAYIEENGWTQQRFFAYRNGRDVQYSSFDEALPIVREKLCKVCARGALYAVESPTVSSYEREIRHSQASRYVERVTNGYAVAAWNDEPHRTKEEVVQALKEAAKAARKDGK